MMRESVRETPPELAAVMLLLQQWVPLSSQQTSRTVSQVRLPLLWWCRSRLRKTLHHVEMVMQSSAGVSLQHGVYKHSLNVGGGYLTVYELYLT